MRKIEYLCSVPLLISFIHVLYIDRFLRLNPDVLGRFFELLVGH
jgi:hypothetical protein